MFDQCQIIRTYYTPSPSAALTSIHMASTIHRPFAVARGMLHSRNTRRRQPGQPASSKCQDVQKVIRCRSTILTFRTIVSEFSSSNGLPRSQHISYSTNYTNLNPRTIKHKKAHTILLLTSYSSCDKLDSELPTA